MHVPYRSCPRHGLTLVELMVTASVAVILLAVAGPSVGEFTANNQLVSTKSAFSAAVALARTEAAKRGQPVILHAVGGGAAGNEYGGGWELVSDDDGNGAVGNADTVLRRYEALSDKVHLSGGASLTFLATGYLAANNSQTFTICRASGGGAGYGVTVTPSGIADVATISNCQ
jgi:type IV fimbrial biogenesis protein FimT